MYLLSSGRLPPHLIDARPRPGSTPPRHDLAAPADTGVAQSSSAVDGTPASALRSGDSLDELDRVAVKILDESYEKLAVQERVRFAIVPSPVLQR